MTDPTLPSRDPPDTDPGGHSPPPSSPPELTLRQLGDLVLDAVRAQGAEMHRSLDRVDGSLTFLVEHLREQGTRLGSLERRLAHLEARAPTEPPGWVDSCEPGGES